MDARFVYLPRPQSGLKFEKSQFQATYGRTLQDLDRELSHLSAKDVTIQAGYTPDKIRLDGWPYSTARPEHPGLIIQFRSKGEILTFKSFRFRSFEENIRAIALTMDALRRVARYGVVEGQQYHGFKQISAPIQQPPASREERVANLRDNAATPGERAAAEEALKRMRAAS